MRLTLLHARKNSSLTIELKTNYATILREFEVDNEDKKFVFSNEDRFAAVTRSTRGLNMKDQSAYLSGSIYYDIHERALNKENSNCSLRISMKVRVFDDDEEIASY
ncbi:hypothetical protein CWI38_0391p0020 [Hamiltosporidium tvaerminnensis]|uniref:Uncharacterized protein n=1 Tax=Hamiltosporidium tvaerminnensis TaxID=1176355 RepID=A0A4Q9LXQ0_9MICR|nr:hypothetical protein CWI38_0391p0020 [Hamiltosporidium tvaerminnensis]